MSQDQSEEASTCSSRPFESTSKRTTVNLKVGGVDKIPKFHLPFKSKSHSYAASTQTWSPVAIYEAVFERTAVSLDLDRRVKRSSDVAWLRGGGSQGHMFEWLMGTRKSNSTSEKNDREIGHSGGVTYKGKEIGLPQPMPDLDVLPPASRYARESEGSIDTTVPHHESSNCPLPPGHVDHGAVSPQMEASPPQLASFATPSRPATLNPFAGVYGNLYSTRTCPTPLPIDYEVAGSLVERPSALDGSQPGHYSGRERSRGHPLQISSEALSDSHGSITRTRAQHVRVIRKWDALPPLPPGEGDQEPLSRDDGNSGRPGADCEESETNDILSSLRPERLSLHHIVTPGRSGSGSADADHSSVAVTERPAPIVGQRTRTPGTDSIADAPDRVSIRTREWDIQSCKTDDLGIDNRFQRQEELAGHFAQRTQPYDQKRQENIRDNNGALYGLPEEDAPTPEGYFYAEMIEIVNDYHQQLQQVIHRAYEAGEMSEEHYLREKWRHRTAMDRKLRAAEGISGYQIITSEADIKESIKQPTGYAIYSSLLKIRDPETWQRMFEPATTSSHLGTSMSSLQREVTAQDNSLVWLLRKIGRVLRFMLAVPDDPDLKTFSSRHPTSDTVSHPSKIGVLGPNIPLRPLKAYKPAIPSPSHASTRTIHTSLSQTFTPHIHAKSSTQIDCPKLSNDTTRVNNNTVYTGATLASPLNDRITKAPRSRGYEDDAFVTIIAPSLKSSRSEKITEGYAAGRSAGGRERTWGGSGVDGGTEITAWPEVDCWGEDKHS